MEEQLLRHYGKCKKDAIILSLSQNDSNPIFDLQEAPFFT